MDFRSARVQAPRYIYDLGGSKRIPSHRIGGGKVVEPQIAQTMLLTLCRERLTRSQHVLNKNGGELTVRDFARTFSVWEWELEKAAELCWIQIEV